MLDEESSPSTTIIGLTAGSSLRDDSVGGSPQEKPSNCEA